MSYSWPRTVTVVGVAWAIDWATDIRSDSSAGSGRTTARPHLPQTPGDGFLFTGMCTHSVRARPTPCTGERRCQRHTAGAHAAASPCSLA